MVVVGSLNVDLPWRVDRHPEVGETVVADRGRPAAGGKGLNQAVAAARVGASVRLVGAVGDDADGRWLRGVAVAEGIDVTDVTPMPRAATGAALIVVAGDGTNTVSVDPGANGRLTVERLELDRDDVVVAQLEVPPEAVRTAFALAAAAGARTVLNPSPVGVGAALVGLADVVVVNQIEAAALAAELPGRSGQVVVTTMGAAGARAVGPDGPIEVAAPAVTAVDTTGAGDCFLGVLAAGLAERRPMPAALERAVVAASRSVTRRGTVDAMPTAAELSAS